MKHNEYKEYIHENANKKSVKEMAQELGIKERKVRKFLKSEKPPPPQLVDPDKKHSRLSDILIFLSIVLIAFIVRWVYLTQIKSNPFFVPSFHGLDDYLYDTWAMNIANGDIVGKEVFYGLPLYPYFLGVVYFLFGHSVFTAKLLQFFIGSASCGLVYLIGRKVFNRAIGIIAALILSFYSTAIFFEGLFVSAFMAVFLNCLLVLLLLFTLEKPSPLKWACIGLLVGVSALASASIFIFVPFLIYWVFKSSRSTDKKRSLIYITIMLLCMCLAIAPVAIRNNIVGKDFVPITAHGGITFYAGNNPLSDGSFYMPEELGANVIDNKENSLRIAEEALKKELKPSQVSSYWFTQGFKFIKENPGKYTRLLLKKAILFWNTHEIPDIIPMFFFRRYSSLLRLPLFSFAVICPLGLIGMFLCMRIKQFNINLLYLFIASVYLSTVIYFVNSRYRSIAAPYLCIFAAVTIYWIYTHLVSKDFNALFGPVVGILIIGVITNIKIMDYNPVQAYNNLGIILQHKEKYKDAIEAYKSAIEIEPGYAHSYYNLGILYHDTKKYNKAIEQFKIALQINPNFALAHKRLGLSYAAIGQTDKAHSHWEVSLRLDPHDDSVKQLMKDFSK